MVALEAQGQRRTLPVTIVALTVMPQGASSDRTQLWAAGRAGTVLMVWITSTPIIDLSLGLDRQVTILVMRSRIMESSKEW